MRTGDIRQLVLSFSSNHAPSRSRDVDELKGLVSKDDEGKQNALHIHKSFGAKLLCVCVCV